MEKVRELLWEMKEKKHPGHVIVQAALDSTNSPEYLEGVARLLAEAARLDRCAEVRLIASLAEGIGA
jgi:hypothetical protein